MSHKYCGKCGSRLDKKTGFCPNCNGEELYASKHRRLTSKKRVKAPTREQSKTSIRKVLLLTIIIISICFGLICVLSYFNIIDVQIISYFLYRNGIVQKIEAAPDPQNDNYIPTEEDTKYDEEKNIIYADDELVVIFDSSVEDSQLNEVIEFLNGDVVGVIPELNLYQISLPGSYSLDQIETIANDLMVKYEFVSFATYDSATPNANDAVYVPNDPWNKDVDQNDWIDNDVDGSNWWAEAIGLRDAWDYNEQFDFIKVGICDTSFDIKHEDLKNKCEFPSRLLESRNVMTPWWHSFDLDTWLDLNKWSVSRQTNYHGSHVAGIIGAESDNKKGITGIVKNAKLLLAPYYADNNSVQYLRWDTSTYANLAYLVKAGAKVINFSQGKTGFLTSSNSSYSQKAIEREGNLSAIAIAKLLEGDLEGENDFIVIQSAGNGIGDTRIGVDALQNGWFASITDKSNTAVSTISITDVKDRVIIVGAAEQDKTGYRCTSFSNYGSQVELFAPGSDIYSTVPGELFYDFQFSGGYAMEQGTSMAAPIVTGICALTWAANPKLTGAEIKNIVCNNTTDIVKSNPVTADKNSYRLVNAKLSVEAALNDKNKTSSKSNETADYSSIPTDAVNYNGHHYYLYTGGIASSYEDALQFCNNKNGYLATLTSKDENDFVYLYMIRQNCENAYFGLNDIDNDGHWEWCTGETSSYSNWHYGEPNGENPNEDYAMFYYKYSDGTWNDGDFGDSTVNGGNAFICEWGDYSSQEVATTGDGSSLRDRNVVLALDVSGSMEGTPIDETKNASNNFVNTILKENADIGIVTYDDSSEIATGLSNDKYNLQNIISSLAAGGETNIEAGLRDAAWMLEKSGGKKKIIVLMSDGEPNEGLEGEELIAYADKIKKAGIRIYTIGFFDSLSDKSSAQYLMEHIASDGCHYEASGADQLVFFFEDMADQINGQKYIYVRIACPVDVSVNYNGEELNSEENVLSTRTSFGTLTFEESREEFGEGIDDRVKVLRLKDGVDYDVKLTGTGHGIMNYTIGFMDDEGEYSDLRQFKDIKITKKTTIDTVASNTDESMLNIDQDGDGKYDLRLRAQNNSVAEEIPLYVNSWIKYIIIAALILILLDIIAIVLYLRSKRRGR